MVATVKDERAFPTLDEDDLRQLEPFATRVSYSSGEVILRRGQSDIDLVVVESGQVDILNPADANKLIASHLPGQFAGDIDLLTRRPIIFTAVANGETRVLRVPGSRFRQLLNAVPRLGEKMLVAFQVRRQTLQRGGVLGIRVVGPGGCGDTNRVREFLHKNFVPYTWIESTAPQGRAALLELGSPKKLPAVDCGEGNVLQCPPLHELAKCAGVWRGCPEDDVELAIVGAGPAGIAAAVYAASEGLRTVVLDKLGPGGQAGGSSKIENFIGFPAGLSGTDLATRGVLQMLKFGATMVAPVSVQKIELAADDSQPHVLNLDCGAMIRTRTILASTGVRWRRLEADGAERFERAGVYYTCTAVEARLHEDCDVAVVGAGNSAGQAVMFLAERVRGRTVHMIIRRRLGPGMSDYLVERIRGTSNIIVHEGVEISTIRGNRQIESIELMHRDDPNGKRTELSCRGVFVFIGAEPHADWLPQSVARDKLGYILTGTDVASSGQWPLAERDPCPLETTVPRILAAGDLRAGSTKRVGFAVGDGSLAVTCAHRLRVSSA